MNGDADQLCLAKDEQEKSAVPSIRTRGTKGDLKLFHRAPVRMEMGANGKSSITEKRRRNAKSENKRDLACPLQRNILEHLCGTFSADGDDHITQRLRAKSSFTVGEVILYEISTVYSVYLEV